MCLFYYIAKWNDQALLYNLLLLSFPPLNLAQILTQVLWMLSQVVSLMMVGHIKAESALELDAAGRENLNT